MGRTTISVSDEVADKLHELKGRGESYDDVLRRILADIGEEVNAEDDPDD
ncbi:antitoxin VapB family protein [Halovivax sp.]|nr:antitoxin VapB family protein [Halovivax sp.]